MNYKKTKRVNYQIRFRHIGSEVYAHGLDVYALMLELKKYRRTRKIHWVSTNPKGMTVVVQHDKP